MIITENQKELQRQVAELRQIVTRHFKETAAREQHLVNSLRRIMGHTELDVDGVGRRVYLEAKSVLGDLYPQKDGEQ